MRRAQSCESFWRKWYDLLRKFATKDPANSHPLQNDDPDNFEIWEKLVRTAESLEGGINRNSSSQAITAVRGIYDRFLGKFPLFFGYWKKYADLEFSIAGTEAAEMVRITCGWIEELYTDIVTGL